MDDAVANGANERPTMIPAAWPSVRELCPVRVMAYPVAPNTDGLKTIVPPAFEVVS